MISTSHHGVFTLLSLLSVGTRSVSIHINNAGFELDGALEPNTFEYGVSLLADWSDYDPFNIMYIQSGIQNPTGGTSLNDPIFGANAPEGSNCVYLEESDTSDIGDGIFGIKQTLSDVVEANTKYTLSVFVGRVTDNCWTDSTDGAECYSYDSTQFPGYSVILLAGSSIIAEDDNSLFIPSAQWRESSITVDIYHDSIYIGETLRIRLINKNLVEGEVVFDDVRLEAVKHTTTTQQPTEAPLTSSPTDPPSQAPTIAPSKALSDDPTISPSKAPSEDPSLNPSQSSTSPTFITESPTQNTIAPFIEATDKPTKAVFDTTEYDDDVISTSDDDDDDDTESTDDEKQTAKYIVSYGILVMIGGFSVVLVVIVVYCGCMRRKKRKEVKVKEEITASEQDTQWIEEWLQDTLKLPQYADNFVTNGYENMNTIASIADKRQLDEIGITKKGHQTLLMSEIEKLRGRKKKHKKEEKVIGAKVDNENIEGNIYDRNMSIPAMVMVQSLSASSAAAIQKSAIVKPSQSSVKVFVEEDDNDEEEKNVIEEDENEIMDDDDDVIMDDIQMFRKGTFTKKGMLD